MQFTRTHTEVIDVPASLTDFMVDRGWSPVGSAAPSAPAPAVEPTPETPAVDNSTAVAGENTTKE